MSEEQAALARRCREKLAAGVMIDIAELAAVLDVNERTIRRRVEKDARFPRPQTMGARIVRFRPRDVADLLGEGDR